MASPGAFQTLAIAGTLVHCPPGTLRSAFAAEDGTTVLGIGAKPGEVFEPSPWERIFVGFGLYRQGDVDAARAEIQAAVAERPDEWQGHFNLACLEALEGRRDEALTALERAAELEPETVARLAREDSDFDELRDDPRYLAVAGQPDAGGQSA